MKLMRRSTLWPLHVLHLGSEAPVLHLQLHDASTQQVGLLLHQLQMDSDLSLTSVRGFSNLGNIPTVRRWQKKKKVYKCSCLIFIHLYLVSSVKHLKVFLAFKMYYLPSIDRHLSANY